MQNSFFAVSSMFFGDNRCDGLAPYGARMRTERRSRDSAEEDTANQYPQQNGNPAKYGANGAVDETSANNRGKSGGQTRGAWWARLHF